MNIKQRAIELLELDGFTKKEILNLLQEPKGLGDEIAMQVMTHFVMFSGNDESYLTEVCRLSYMYADAMLKYRNNNQSLGVL